MSGRRFVDSNVAVYQFDDSEPDKQRAARAIFDSDDAHTLVLSAQVLSEFYVTVTRKLGVAPDVARDAVAELGQFPLVATDLALVRAAIHTAERHQLSYWDAQIIEAAVTAGCDRVLTEDLNAGQTIRGVEIVNPFE